MTATLSMVPLAKIKPSKASTRAPSSTTSRWPSWSSR